MTRLTQLAALGPVVALAFFTNVSGAAPLSHGAGPFLEETARLPFVEQVHGTHRACLRGWVHRWGGRPLASSCGSGPHTRPVLISRIGVFGTVSPTGGLLRSPSELGLDPDRVKSRLPE